MFFSESANSLIKKICVAAHAEELSTEPKISDLGGSFRNFFRKNEN